MSAGDIIAIYAAVAATTGLGWQVYSWRRSRATIVRVSATTTENPSTSEPHVLVMVVNLSDHAIRVVRAGVYMMDGSGGPIGVGRDQLGLVRPHDATRCMLSAFLLEQEDFDFDKPVRAFAELSTGERVESEPAVLSWT